MNISTKKLTAAALTCAAYAALTLALAPISYGPLQFRVSEVLCVLPFFVPCTVWGLAAGCALANLAGSLGLLDVVFGSAATLGAGLCMAALGGGRAAWPRLLLAALMPVLWNGAVIGAVLTWTLTAAPFPRLSPAFWVFAGQVACGELAVMAVLGLPTLRILSRSEKFLAAIRQYTA